MRKSSENKSLPFYLLITGLFLFLTSPALFTRSMFMDGIYYASIARNLADGLGSFWHPEFTKTHFKVFHEHPPLALWLQSLFFRIFGDHFWVERLYSLLLVLLSAWTSVAIWKRTSQEAFPNLNWLPLLFGVSVPLLWWAASNNVLENTMMLFVLLSVLFFVKSLNERTFLNLAIGGLMIFLGSICKGPVALFPLSFFFWALCFRSSMGLTRMLRDTSLALLFVLLPLSLTLLFSEEAFTALKDYFLNQVVHGVSERETVDSRFYIAERLFGELIPSLLILGVLFSIGAWKKIKPVQIEENRKWGWSFLALGLSGVLPIMMSSTQGGFYMVPALPIFGLSFAFFSAPYIDSLIGRSRGSKKGMTVLWGCTVLLLALGIASHIYHFGRIGKDKDKIELVCTMKEHTDSERVSINPNLSGDFGLHAYSQRYARISLDPGTDELHELLLLPKDAKDRETPDHYERVLTESDHYLLFQKKE